MSKETTQVARLAREIDTIAEIYMDPPSSGGETVQRYHQTVYQLIGVCQALLAALEMRSAPVAVLQSAPGDPVLTAFLCSQGYAKDRREE